MIKVSEVENKEIWERFVLGQKPNIFLQSWNWGEFHQSLGEKIFRFGFWEGKELVGVALLIKEKARRGVYLSCPGGPLIGRRQKQELNLDFFRIFVEKIKQIGWREKAVFIRVRPSVLETPENRSLFKQAGFVSAPMHLHAETTLHLDLDRSEEQILAAMRKNTRYSIRRSAREGVKTQISRSVKNVDQLYRLQMEVVKRRKFVPFSKEFFKKHFTAFINDGQIAFIKADYKEETLAIGMFIFYGDTAFYHYSGSSSGHTRVFASYAMLWEAIKEAKKRKCQIFDFWGIASTDNPRHRFAGVTTFKKGFGGQRVDWLHAQDLPLSRKYGLIFIFETGRRFLRRL